jgi:hypothetical protein
MDVAATSTVSDVAVHNFTGLGLLTDGSGAARSLVRSVATGVGNNLTVELNAPSPPAGS